MGVADDCHDQTIERIGTDTEMHGVMHSDDTSLGIKDQPAVVNQTVLPRPLLNMTCSFDHRVCDGADVALFLNRVRELIETPELLIFEP